jgi:hypothetical protein
VLAQSAGLYSLVLGNCGPSALAVSGSIAIRPTISFLDDRLIPLLRVFVAFSLLTTVYVLVWSFRLVAANPKIQLHHQLLVVAIVSAIVASLLLTAFLWVWDSSNHRISGMLIGAGIFAGTSRALLYYLTLVSLQWPADVSVRPFFVAGLILSMIMIAENYGITEFEARQSGEWNLGFGTPPCTQFLALSLFCLGLIIFAGRTPPPENASLEQRRMLLVIFSGGFFLYFGGSLLTAAVRIGASLIDTRDIEWVPFMIEPVFFLVTMFVNGWFWLHFNPQGWQAIDDDTGELGVDPQNGPESLVGSGIALGSAHSRERPEFIVAGSDEDVL